MKKIKSKNEKRTGNKKEKKSIWRSILSICLFVAIIGISIGLLFALYIVLTSPDFVKQELYQKEPTILYDRNGQEFARVGAENSTVVTYDEIPEVVIDALIATEDSRFFQHNGLDLFRFLKASAFQFLGKKDAGGASTLSMQVIKNTYSNKKRHGIEGIIRKFKDIYMAVFKLEANYTKEEIIEFYLNSQWLANEGNINWDGIIGIEQASLYYFGKSSKDMNLAEASLMVGMFNNPYRYNPYKNPEGCRNRQRAVLNLMIRHGYITEEERDDILAIPISQMLVTHEKQSSEIKAESNQAFIDYVLNEVQQKLELNPKNTALKIYTTYDPKVQSYLENIEKGDVYTYLDDVVQEGIAVTSTEDGSIIAISGGRNYTATGTNRGAYVKKQPGSTAKPIFDYAMYIEHISQSTYSMFMDEPTTYSNGTPISNYDNSYKGYITMRYALKDSRNIPALKAFKEVAALDQKIIEDFVHSVGIDYGDTLYEPFSIGGMPEGMTPLQMSAAYAVFGRGGYYIEPYSYTKVINTETEKEYTYSYGKKKVMEESTAFMINDLLNYAYTGSRPSGGTNVGGKTGTTNLDSDTKKKYGLKSGALKDVWYTTYSPSYSIALWFGYDELKADSAEKGYYLTSSTGGTARKAIMNYLSKNIHVKDQKFTVPKSVTTAKIEVGTMPPKLCSSITPSSSCATEYFVKGTEPTDVSAKYDQLANPTNGNISYSGNNILISWSPISTPDNTDASFGSLGYEIYLKNSDGSETYLGFTSGTTFTYNGSSNYDYTFIIKTAYSTFKDNRSSGLTVTTVDENLDDIMPNNPTNGNTSNTDDDELD